MAKTVGVVLSGCGFLDGSEIHEATLALLELDRRDAKVSCFAPDVDQADVVDHRTARPAGERRNVLCEAARIARGKVADLREARAADLDALLFPGGYGAAKNLCDFARAGAEARPHPEVARIVREMSAAKKPMAFLCIAPAVAAATFRGTDVHPRLTIGEDAGAAAALERMGARHEIQPVTGVTVDRDHRIVSTPCYMFDARIRDIETGVVGAIKALLEMA
jgi:enhancing lycopene biosynthesis protein 2